VLGGENRIPETVRHMHGAEQAMRDRAADERDLARAGNSEVADVLSAPANEAVVFLAKNRSADAAIRHACRPVAPAA
jgi:hypothetical protein